MAIYPTFGADTALVEKMMENYPPEMLKAFGMSTGLSLSSVPGYFAFVFAFTQLFIAVQAANYGFSFLSVEERELTADFLMTKPVSRRRIIVSKFLAAFTALTITNAITWISSFASIELFKNHNEYDPKAIALLLSTNALFQLYFIVIGMVISVSVSKIRSVLSFSVALVFLMYILNALKSIIGGDLLGILTPFYYFEPGYILQEAHLNTPMVIVGSIIIIISMVTSYILYNKRNIRSL